MEPNRPLRLNRPLVVLDTETTGTVPYRDRIVEIALVKLHPDGRSEEWVRRIDPEMRIPIEATAVHGITNADVEGSPTFRRVAGEMMRWIGDADLCGFNIHGFDLRILQAEFARCGEPFPLEGRRIIDAQVIFHKREPRDLSAAVEFYLGHRHEGAHGALADARATLEILQAQLVRYPDLPPSADGLADVSRRASGRFVDPDRRLEWRDGEACIAFGKNAGRRLRDLVLSDPDYIGWILNSDFPGPLKTILREALEGRFPAPEPEESP